MCRASEIIIDTKGPNGSCGMGPMKRRLSEPGAAAAPVSKNVRFSDEESVVFLVEKISNCYSNRLLWYTKAELDRILQMEVRRNLACPQLVDRTNNSIEDLTWRGIEHYQPGKDPSMRYVNINSLVRVIVDASRDLDGCDHEALRFVSEALSQNDRVQALQKGLQDEAHVQGRMLPLQAPFQQLQFVRPSLTVPRNWTQFLTMAAPSFLMDHLLWMIRIVGFFVSGGFFLSYGT